MKETIKCPTCNFEWFPKEFREYDEKIEKLESDIKISQKLFQEIIEIAQKVLDE